MLALACQRRSPATGQGWLPGRVDLPRRRKAHSATYPCDATDPPSVDQLFAHIDQPFPKVNVCLFNASARTPGPITDVDREQARAALLVSLMAAPSSHSLPLRLVEPRLQTLSLFLTGFVQHEREDSCAFSTSVLLNALLRIHPCANQPSLRRRHVLTAVSTA